MPTIALILAVAGLGARPAALTGPDPAAYVAKLEVFARGSAAGALGHACPAASVRSLRGSPMASDWPQRNGVTTKTLTGPIYEEHLAVAGCAGDARVVAVNLILAPLGPTLGVLQLPPGTGAVDYRLFQDVAPAAAAAAGARSARGCSSDEAGRSTHLADTALLTPYAAGRPWAERWTFSVCGALQPVDIDFTPTADGGTDYHMRGR